MSEINIAWKRHPNAADFLKEVQPLLEENELDNNMMLGLCLGLNREEFINKDYHFISVSQNGIPIAASVNTIGKALIAVKKGEEIGIPYLADYYLAQNISLKGVFGDKKTAPEFSALYGKTPIDSCFMLSHRLKTLQKLQLPKGFGTFAKAADRELLADWVILFEEEVGIYPVKTKEQALSLTDKFISEKKLYVWVHEGQIVNCAAEMRQTPNIGIVGLVYTPISNRGQGFAQGSVWNLSSHILKSGLKYVGLFTDADNAVSNKIYQKIGYVAESEFIDINF
jgi:RimJ/RimL family protein N-acetyltransferase